MAGLGCNSNKSMPTIPQLLQSFKANRQLSSAVREGNAPPHLSWLGVGLLGMASALFCAGIGAWQIYKSLGEQHDTESKSLHVRFETVFASIAKDLKLLAETPILDCTPATSQAIALHTLRSEFARSFFIELSADTLCSPFGQTDMLSNGLSLESKMGAYSQGESAVQKRPGAAPFTISSLGQLKPSVLLKYQADSGARIWAEIPANRLLSDLSALRPESNGQSTIWSLNDHLSKPILWRGSNRQDTMPFVHFRELVSETHGYRLNTTISLDQFIACLKEWVWLWASLSLLLSALLIRGINQHYAARMSPESKMKIALQKRQIEPVIQPIVSLATGECLGGEVLMRWKHPVRGLIPPAEFISLAEENGMIVPMSEMLMRKARDQLAELKGSTMYFSFNVTAAQLRDPMFPQKILKIFDSTGLPPKSVVIELTEREAIGEQDGEILIRLRALGFRIAIDDFGTGQSSLSMLQALQIDRIKIDREFVRTIDESTERRPVLDTIVMLAKELAVPVIAEGIETQAQWDYLAKRKVEAAQGYLIAKPMLISDFIKWLDTREVKAFIKPVQPEARLGSTDRRELRRTILKDEAETMK
jgi:EAL domain-containing protein (putative c-di-GMP-specific phosphodiesterase class I)